ncbi:MAG: carbamoyl-phosphate synthase large subunit, partial [Anaerolineales bacterium]
AGNFVVVCPIENLDPMGIHTGDSITVAPTQTLTDREYQVLRDQSRIIIDVVGIETGGSNIQFAVNPRDGRVLVIEMNPRVSRSSALASKATGFPIAKIAALLAVGYTLDEIQNDITQTTVAAFEPSIDYVVTKMPRWAFEKFPGVDPTLGSQMKSVGEVMAIGRTFRESFLKGLQSLELPRPSFPTAEYRMWDGELDSLGHPTDKRIWAVWEALRQGKTVEEVAGASQFDLWFTTQIAEIAALEKSLTKYRSLKELPQDLLRVAKQTGFSDEHIAWLLLQSDLSEPEPSLESPQIDAMDVRTRRIAAGILPTYHVVDTCAAEFESYTPYLYSSYETESEAEPTDREKVIILGSGPNRIGQGIEFDYCCVHAAFALREAGYEAIMINCNPETVSTDYDTSDRLYFEPLTLEHTLNIIEREQPIKGVVVQFGGQTPLKLAAALEQAGITILGTSFDSIDIAEDRGRFCQLMDELGIPVPAHSMAQSLDEALQAAAEVTYPVIVRPSYVLGGRAMAIVYDDESLGQYIQSAFQAAPGQPILIDHYLEDAYEIDLDAIADGEQVAVCGIMQHIEEAGIHSGDSACVLPPYKVSAYHLSHIREYTEQIGQVLKVCGLMNIQFAVKDDIVYILEVNPRASRTVPYVSKATGFPLAKLATRVIMGSDLSQVGLGSDPKVGGFFVKEAVLPFKKFFGVDSRLGPEMRSTGEVMGHAKDFGHAFAKAQLAAGNSLPLSGTVFISVNDYDKSNALKLARDLSRLGFKLVATQGTAAFCSRAGLEVERINKVSEGSPHVVDLISSGEIDLVINTPLGSEAYSDGSRLRMAAVRFGVPMNVCSLQEHYRMNESS